MNQIRKIGSNHTYFLHIPFIKSTFNRSSFFTTVWNRLTWDASSIATIVISSSLRSIFIDAKCPQSASNSSSFVHTLFSKTLPCVTLRPSIGWIFIKKQQLYSDSKVCHSGIRKNLFDFKGQLYILGWIISHFHFRESTVMKNISFQQFLKSILSCDEKWVTYENIAKGSGMNKFYGMV